MCLEMGMQGRLLCERKALVKWLQVCVQPGKGDIILQPGNLGLSNAVNFHHLDRLSLSTSDCMLFGLQGQCMKLK